jgi:hypothetical protein
LADVTETFESYTVGEIDGQGDWSEVGASTDDYKVLDTGGVAHGGTKFLFSDGSGSSNSVVLEFTSEDEQVDATFYVRSTNASGNNPRFGFSASPYSSSDQGPHIRVYRSDLQNYDGSSWQDITSANVISDDTWYKIRIVVDISANTFELYLDDVKQGTTHDFRNNLSSIAAFHVNCGGSVAGDDLYFDDLEITLGTAGSTDTNLLDSKLVVKNSTTNLFDGKTNIIIKETDLLDGKCIIVTGGSDTDILDGKTIIQTIGTVLLDGEVTIDNLESGLLDGKISLVESTVNLLSGKLIIGSNITELFDGKVVLGNISTNLLDGKTIISSAYTDFLDSKITIKDITTVLLDGKVTIGTIVTLVYDGKVIVKNSSTDLLDGKIILPTPDTNLLDGKAIIKDVITETIDGNLNISSSTTNILDGKVYILGSGEGLSILDGRLGVKIFIPESAMIGKL